MKYFIGVIILTLFTLQSSFSQSIFEKEGLMKIATVKEGVHKIDVALLKAMGLNPAEINPNTIQVYGMPGGHIPQANAVDYPLEPQALPLQVKANTNSGFESDEAIYFFADAVTNIAYDSASESYQYSNNLYSDSLYFFIDINAETVNNIEWGTTPTPTSVENIDWFDQVYFHEKDEVNILRSGREWFGESFYSNREQSFPFQLNAEMAAGKEVRLTSAFMAQTHEAATLNISINGLDLASLAMPTISVHPYQQEGYIVTEYSKLATSLLSGTELNVRLSFVPSGGGKSTGYLDYIFMTVPQKLKYTDDQIILRNSKIQQAGDYQFGIAGMSENHHIWDVSNPTDYHKLKATNNNFTINQQVESGERKFVIFTTDDAYSPEYVEKMSSQQLKKDGLPDFIIVTHESLRNAAQTLASHRSSHNNYEVEVTTVDEIFNEFGSGRRDVSAIRNYIRYFYLKNPSKLKYVLFLGSATYDFKDRINGNTNLVPVYQSKNSLHPVFTYASDDFYGFMDEEEGEWTESADNVDDLDLGIGRIPAKNLEEAKAAVKKIIHYETNPNVFEKWRNDLYFIADDEDGNIFHRDSERLADFVIDNHQFYNINKLYLGAFEQEMFASTERSPKMREAIKELIDKGALIVNYIGHGSANSWANESILDKSMVSEWNNIDKLPLFVTATCEYGRFDNPTITSGAQQMLLQPNGGAIALLTTSRPVESSSNATLNRAFFENVFKTKSGSPQKLGDIIKNTKNDGIVGVKNRNFILLGDPALTLAEPKNNLNIVEVLNENGKTDTLNSMSKVTVNGIVENPTGQKLSSFNGELTAELYDKPLQSSTIDPSETIFDFLTYDQALYRGNSTVENGNFSFTFYVPKEIDYKIDKGRFSLYARQAGSLEDANGFSNDFLIGGSTPMANQDNEGPDIQLYLNDRAFKDGDRTGSNVELLVDLFDEHGISISNSNVNPGISLSIDGGDALKLNDFFYYDLDSYQQGSLKFGISGLAEGKHYLTVTALDAFNNRSKLTLSFEVVGNEQLSILDFVLFPNPASNEVNIRIRQNRKNEEVELSFHILDNQGKLVYSHSYRTKESFLEDVWNLKDGNGKKLSPGMYFVRVFLRSVEDHAKTEQFKKLIVIN